MPLPLGHTLLGLTTLELDGQGSLPWGWRTVIFITVLSNLPDLDIAAGLLIQGNGCVFHRGFTHSLAFAFLAGALAANGWRIRAGIPKMHWTRCTSLVLAHLVGDVVFTNSPVSFFWPLELYRSPGFSGWGESLVPILSETYKDGGIVVFCLLLMILTRLTSSRGQSLPDL